MARNRRTGRLHFSPTLETWTECWANGGACPFTDHTAEDDAPTRQKLQTAALSEVMEAGGGELASGQLVQPLGDGIFRVGTQDGKRWKYYRKPCERLTGNAARRARALPAPVLVPTVVAPAADVVSTVCDGEAEARWQALSWNARRYRIETFARAELKKHNLTDVQVKWSRRQNAWGYAKTSLVGGVVVVRELFISDRCQDLDEASVTDTVLHEIAHFVAGADAGHGPAWAKACETVDDGRGLLVAKATYAMNDGELERAKARMLQEREHLRTASKWLGTCPQGHEFPRNGKLRAQWLCANEQCKPLDNDQRIITYERRDL